MTSSWQSMWATRWQSWTAAASWLTFRLRRWTRWTTRWSGRSVTGPTESSTWDRRDGMRRRRGSGVATGALVLVAGVVATWGYFWLTAQPLGQGSYPLMVQLADAGGLQRGDRVRLAGVQVGTVRKVGLQDGAVL